MPPPFRIILSPEASSDLTAIHDWIAKDSPDNAAKVVERLLSEMNGLSTFPTRYAVVETERNLPFPLRRMPVPPYRVFYWVEEQRQAVRVLAVQHGQQQSWA
jgi:plasmid stabilization system protein ParE